MKDYHNGPVSGTSCSDADERRSCTDLYCFIILVLFVIAMLVVGIIAWSGNNFSKLSTPYDSEGKGCGVDYPGYPYIYFVSPHYDSLWRTVCLKECPKGGENRLECQPNKYITSCDEVNSADSEKAVQIYEAYPVRGTLCLPSSPKIQEQISTAMGSDNIQNKISMLGHSWPIILAAIPIAIVLSLIFMLIMRFTAGIFVYLLFAITIVFLVGLGIYLVMPHEEVVSGIQTNGTAAKIFGGICIALGVIILIAFLCYRKRVALAATIVKVSARFVSENCIVAFLPIILFIFMIIFLALWILEGLGYYSMGQPIYEQKQLPFQHFQTTTFVKIVGLVHIFQLFWGIFFLVETGDFIIAGTATSWYFLHEDPYSESQHRFRGFHIGSVALGSFFMALFGFIRFLYELLAPEDEEEQGCKGTYKKFCDCCCLLCVSYIFNCFNSGAYTFMHLAGDSYCTSAWEVVSLRIKEPVSTAVVAFMSVLFSALVRVGITAATIFAAYLILTKAQPYKTEVSDPVVPLVVIGVLAFAISSFFVSLYSEAMEAVYVCYLADKQAGGRDDKAPSELKDFLEEAKHNNHFIE